MKLATLLIIVLSNGGYWFSGRPTTINLRSAVKEGLPDAEVSWELKLDGAELDRGKIRFPSGDNEVNVKFQVAPARVRITLHWIYRITARTSGKELETGDVPINLFPGGLTDGLAERVDGKKVVIWDDPAGLPKFFEKAKVPFVRVAAAGSLQLAVADVVLVGADALGDSPFDQSSLLDLAESGASVMIFRQTRPARLIGYALTSRDAPARLEWRADHPLLGGFEPQDLQSWIAAAPALQVVQLPADEPALEIASFPPEVPSAQPVPIDAVLLSKSVGKGRIVLCQLPLGDWSTDPRSQMLLNNAMDYLLSRPQPTPRPSERPVMRPAETQPVPTIQLNGDKP